MTSTVLHTLAAFVLVMLALRALGKRELAQMSPVDLVVIFVVGDLMAGAITSEDTSLTGAGVAIATLVCLNAALAWASLHFPRLRPLLNGRATVLLRDGVPDRDAMRRERVTLDDLHEAARAEGVADLADVRLLVLEADGGFSFILASGTQH
ncbi:DUF421 domain-containing protein [Nocardioides yefusunii]|uniref:DUF421 domain-containing protein n=1 Tax=Nocardioides yefusunii TaxID=2500546 RepID=A0ABW1QRQ8_9ACTN|nr:YetF domain-containing protein [Nocardioides yefusunii]